MERDLGAESGLRIAGLDEVGRGPLAGPVTAAAVRLDPRKVATGQFAQLADSKTLSEKTRDQLSDLLWAEAEVALGWATVEEIDRLNILAASLLAMERAFLSLAEACDWALVDGNKIPARLPCQAKAVVGGDAKVLSIAAASIVAKVARDRRMQELDQAYPGYGWAKNKGYPTKDHRAALMEMGATPAHRRSFAPVRLVLQSHEET